MQIEFKETSRGRHMIFVRVLLDEATQKAGISAVAQTAGGNPIPAKLIDQGVPGELTLVVPQLTVPLVATVRTADRTAQLTIDPQRAKRASQFNTLRRNPAASLIRNADDKVRHTAGAIYTTDVVPEWVDKQIIGRGRAETVAPADSESATGPVDVLALGTDGTPYPGAAWTSLGDTASHPDDDPNCVHRRVGFSLRLPLFDVPDVILWARGLRCEDGDVFLALAGDDLCHRKDDFAVMTCPAMSDAAYDHWFRTHCATREELSRQRVRRFPVEPTFSFVVPLYKTPLSFLHDMATSVLGQTYSKLQLVLVNASPEEGGLTAAVSKLAATDERVSVVTLEQNLGITENTNFGIQAAKGDFVAFMDHDDTIEPDLLYRYVEGINRYPETDLLYCDEDKLRGTSYIEPNFKPDWDPEMLCSQNYVCHLLTVRKSILDTLEPATREFDGSQDQNMTFRVGELARNVYHARRVLYHWRISENSTAVDPNAKPYTTVAGIKSVQGHLDRTGIAGKAGQRADIANVYQISYELPDQPSVSIVIPNKDQVPVLDRCLASIRNRTTYKNYEVVIIENNSTDPKTFAYYDTAQAADPRVKVVTCQTDGTFNYARLNNFGVAQTTGDYVLLLNNDTEVISPDWLEQMLGPATTPGVGIVGAKLLFPDDTIQHAGVCFHREGPAHLGFHLPRNSHDYYQYYLVMRDCTAVTGACLLTSRKLWDELGGMDEKYAVSYNDVDFCLRVRQKGLRVVYQAAAELYHYESITRGVVKSPAQYEQWMMEEGMLKAQYPRYYAEGDPYQNPNVEGLWHHLHW